MMKELVGKAIPVCPHPGTQSRVWQAWRKVAAENAGSFSGTWAEDPRAFGLKLLCGHFPSTPESPERADGCHRSQWGVVCHRSQWQQWDVIWSWLGGWGRVLMLK